MNVLRVPSKALCSTLILLIKLSQRGQVLPMAAPGPPSGPPHRRPSRSRATRPPSGPEGTRAAEDVLQAAGCRPPEPIFPHQPRGRLASLLVLPGPGGIQPRELLTERGVLCTGCLESARGADGAIGRRRPVVGRRAPWPPRLGGVGAGRGGGLSLGLDLHARHESSSTCCGPPSPCQGPHRSTPSTR